MAKKILIVEDDAALAQALAGRFQAEGFEVFLSIDGESGLRLAEERHPDLILLDLILPHKNGFEVLEELSQKPELSKILVMVLTNLESAADVERASAFGIKAYLVKANYSLDEIVKKAEKILAEHASR